MSGAYRRLQQPDYSQELAQPSCDDLLSYRVACNNTKVVNMCSVVKGLNILHTNGLLTRNDCSKATTG